MTGVRWTCLAKAVSSLYVDSSEAVISPAKRSLSSLNVNMYLPFSFTSTYGAHTSSCAGYVFHPRQRMT